LNLPRRRYSAGEYVDVESAVKFSNREAHKFVKASIVWFALMVGLMSFGAFAAQAAIKTKKAPRVAETYAATEAEDDASYNAKPVRIAPAALPPSPVVAPRAAALPAPRLAATPHLASPAVAGPAESAAYDPVPSDQIASFMKRLQLVAVLLQRHGRAYDYRIHTVRQLETVLASMEAAQAPSPATIRSAPARARAQLQLPAAPAPQPESPPVPTESEETSELPGA
jgi:hypothetical protein